MSDLPDGWVETTLGEVAKVQTGPFGSQLHNKDYVDVGTPMITVEHIVNDKINHTSNIPKVSDEDKQRLSKYILNKGDIVFSRVGSVDRSAYVSAQEHGWMFSGRLLRVRADLESVDSHYLHYALTKKSTKKYIKKIAVGATMPSINTSILSEIPLVIPPLQEQKSIANILSSLDEKIELLREQNETLETLAQTIFKEWFVNFNYPDATGEMVDSEFGEIPKGWKNCRLGDELEVKRGGSPRPIKDYISDTGYRWLKISDATATNSPFIFEIKEHIKKEGLNKTTLLKKGALVLSNSATPGIPKFLEVNSCIHDGWLHFPNTAVFSYQYLYLFFKHIREPLLQQGNGSVFKNLKTDILKNWNMVIPDNRTLQHFDELIIPIFEKIKNNASQVQTLTKTRDTLLPKLMSGEVRIN